jgi:hypothetical protein
MVAGLHAELRERTRVLYGVAFQQLGLPAKLQEKVIDILTQQQQQLEQQAFEAAQSGSFPAPPSPEEMRTQKAQQESFDHDHDGLAQKGEYKEPVLSGTLCTSARFLSTPILASRSDAASSSIHL